MIKGGNIFRSGTAAAAEDGCTVCVTFLDDGSEFFGHLRIVGDSVAANNGNAGIGLADQRPLDTAAQLADQIRCHHICSNANHPAAW